MLLRILIVIKQEKIHVHLVQWKCHHKLHILLRGTPNEVV